MPLNDLARSLITEIEKDLSFQRRLTERITYRTADLELLTLYKAIWTTEGLIHPNCSNGSLLPGFYLAPPLSCCSICGELLEFKDPS
jgi:hypothetical protein